MLKFLKSRKFLLTKILTFTVYDCALRIYILDCLCCHLHTLFLSITDCLNKFVFAVFGIIIQQWKSHWKTRVTLKIERTKYTGNYIRTCYSWITIADTFQCHLQKIKNTTIFCKAFQYGLDLPVWFSVSYFHSGSRTLSV